MEGLNEKNENNDRNIVEFDRDIDEMRDEKFHFNACSCVEVPEIFKLLLNFEFSSFAREKLVMYVSVCVRQCDICENNALDRFAILPIEDANFDAYLLQIKALITKDPKMFFEVDRTLNISPFKFLNYLIEGIDMEIDFPYLKYCEYGLCRWLLVYLYEIQQYANNSIEA